MLHHVLLRLQPASTKLCRKTGILGCTSAFGIDGNIFLACVCQVWVCVLQQITITILIMQYLSHCKILPCYFGDPPWEKTKTTAQKTQKNKTQTTSDQKVSQIFFPLFAHLVVTHSPNRHTYMSMLLPPVFSYWSTALYTEALECSHSPCTRIFRNSQDVLHFKPDPEKH